MTMITPSYGPDYERCKLLVESVNRNVPESIEHVLIVDKRDAPLFRSLSSSRTRVITVESVLPAWLFRLPMARRWWFSFKSLPVRNWILQQVVKLGVGEHIESESYMFVDSDVAFIRPMDPSDFVDPDGRLVLYRNTGMGRTDMHAPWHMSASRLLGLDLSEYHGANYIGNLITWRRDNLLRLHRHLESVSGVPWMEAVCRRWHLSEYILYGVFVEHVLFGRGHFYETSNHCAVSWNRDIATEEGMDSFLASVDPEQVAVMVSSKQYIPVSSYEDKLKQFDAFSGSDRLR